jgi:hypothetical protein
MCDNLQQLKWAIHKSQSYALNSGHENLRSEVVYLQRPVTAHRTSRPYNEWSECCSHLRSSHDYSVGFFMILTFQVTVRHVPALNYCSFTVYLFRCFRNFLCGLDLYSSTCCVCFSLSVLWKRYRVASCIFCLLILLKYVVIFMCSFCVSLRTTNLSVGNIKDTKRNSFHWGGMKTAVHGTLPVNVHRIHSGCCQLLI